ncbi:divalent-cation tolerance protein CutA [Candidatus Woesearchaeota archaeon]|nr:divalent-cation tolerance protein CutA [Candidatus Woesearchaeota archaeon]
MIIIYCPCKNKTEAKNIATKLLNKKLIACANIIQSDSIYNWKNKLCSEKEAIMLLKIKNTNKEKVTKEIKKLHSYDLPAIITINAKANQEFEKWLSK